MAHEHEVRLPDIEVVCRCSSFDVAIVSFYMGKTPHDDIEVVAYVYDTSDIGLICETLQETIKALRSGGWIPMDELDTRPLPN